ncbi:MAG: NAD(P)-dependent oxidoreductase [Candidatus Latescibacteria bacterium]|jgi:dTDP-4-dehydrorhamnose reductase|nr:NAD(P)-dependent oxidoreductase [Candidatus Latescibacterota bacterium]
MARLLITGGSGFIGGHLACLAQVGSEVHSIYNSRRGSLRGVNWHQVDLTDGVAVGRLFSDVKPDAVIHSAAISGIDYCQQNQEEAWACNVTATENVAAACAEHTAKLVHVSTDTVFDGDRGWYSEDDDPMPINFYGETKLAAEDAVFAKSHDSAVARICIVYGLPLTSNAVSSISEFVDRLDSGEGIWLLSDEIRTPIDVLTLCDALLEIAFGDHGGVFHLGGADRVSRVEMGMKVVEYLGADPKLVTVKEGMSGSGDRAPRPVDISLKTDKAASLLNTQMLPLEQGFKRVWPGLYDYRRRRDS